MQVDFTQENEEGTCLLWNQERQGDLTGSPSASTQYLELMMGTLPSSSPLFMPTNQNAY